MVLFLLTEESPRSKESDDKDPLSLLNIIVVFLDIGEGTNELSLENSGSEKSSRSSSRIVICLLTYVTFLNLVALLPPALTVVG
jgi:hypothetical protein